MKSPTSSVFDFPEMPADPYRVPEFTAKMRQAQELLLDMTPTERQKVLKEFCLDCYEHRQGICYCMRDD